VSDERLIDNCLNGGLRDEDRALLDEVFFETEELARLIAQGLAEEQP
jgi:hypothetical protein